MALAVVTATKGRAASGAALTFAIASPAPGNMLVAAFNQFRATAANATITDNQGNTFTSVAQIDTAGDPGSGLFYAKNIASSGTHNVTFTCGTSGIAPSGAVYEVSGADAAAPFTIGESATSTGTSAAPATGSVTNSVADSIYFAFVGNAGASATSTITKNAAWSRHANAVEVDGTQYMTFGMEYLIVASSSARSHTWTTDNVLYTTILAAFLAAAGGGGFDPTTVPPFIHPQHMTFGQKIGQY